MRRGRGFRQFADSALGCALQRAVDCCAAMRRLRIRTRDAHALKHRAALATIFEPRGFGVVVSVAALARKLRVRIKAGERGEKGRCGMSHQMVGQVIDRLLTDEDLRVRFVLNPVEALADLHLRGLALTPSEIDVFVQTDARTWFWREDRVRRRIH